MSRVGSWLVVSAGLAPAAWILGRALFGDLGADPVETLTQHTGDWALRFLLVTLAVTPAHRLLGFNRLVRHRRALGLFAFGYALLHFATFIWLDFWFAWDDIVAEIRDRLWITIGFATLVMMTPLAITSTNRMVRRLGARRWRKLHRLVYACGVGGVLHYWWAVKADTRLPLVYGVVLAILLGARVYIARRRIRQRAQVPA